MEPLSNAVNNAFFFVIDKIIDMQEYFIRQANGIGRIVFLIAILSAALNYALTGTGLKENLIKIFKATVFFMIVMFSYPKIIGWITSYTFSLAQESIYDSVNDYFKETVEEVSNIQGQVNISSLDNKSGNNTFYYKLLHHVNINDKEGLFSDLVVHRNNPPVPHTVVAPANLFKILFTISYDCIVYADKKQSIIPEFSRVLKGFICAFFIMITGAFAMLEYIVCFLEFMLVASVGVILFPLSIWDGSKFLSEKFIGAIVGFFMKMLFCNIAIFLMLYGFISMFYTINIGEGFQGSVDQIIFIVFVCLLFFFICKSAPALAQSLLTGTPNLSASGAISAATGAVAAAGATMGLAKKVGGTVTGGTAKGLVGGIGSLKEAGAASNTVKQLGGTASQQTGAFFSSLAGDVSDSFKSGALGLTRNLLGGNDGTNPHSWRHDFLNKSENGENQSFTDHLDKRKQEGVTRAHNYMNIPLPQSSQKNEADSSVKSDSKQST